MKYKVGDRVIVKRWETIKSIAKKWGEEFIINDVAFAEKMRKYCGRIVTIVKIKKDDLKDGRYLYYIKEDDSRFTWIEEFFENRVFDYGEKIEVSNDKEIWNKKIYVGYILGAKNPYICVGIDEENFKRGEKFEIIGWKYARSLSEKHKAVIDDKEIKISEEVLQALSEEIYRILKRALLEKEEI